MWDGFLIITKKFLLSKKEIDSGVNADELMISMIGADLSIIASMRSGIFLVVYYIIMASLPFDAIKYDSLNRHGKECSTKLKHSFFFYLIVLEFFVVIVWQIYICYFLELFMLALLSGYSTVYICLCMLQEISSHWVSENIFTYNIMVWIITLYVQLNSIHLSHNSFIKDILLLEKFVTNIFWMVCHDQILYCKLASFFHCATWLFAVLRYKILPSQSMTDVFPMMFDD